jgi:hypothetical protein
MFLKHILRHKDLATKRIGPAVDEKTLKKLF